MKRARRIISHHGSDCPSTPHAFREGRCIILTRVDHPGRPSVAWLTGDCQEGRRFQHRRHEFDATQPVTYGGGFWERVSLPAKTD